MFWYEARVMFVLAIAAVALYFFFKICKWLFLTSERREKIDEVKIQIRDTMKCAKDVDDIDETGIEKAEQKIERFIKKKGRNGTSKKSK